MSNQRLKSIYENNLGNESIDFDFFETAYSNRENDDELLEISGVNRVEIIPIQNDSKLESEKISNDINSVEQNVGGDITKCIAFEKNLDQLKDDEDYSRSESRNSTEGEISPILGSSLSSSTPSDLTNVTPLSSASSSSSLKDKDYNDDVNDSADESTKSDNKPLKLLAEAVESLSLNKKRCSSVLLRPANKPVTRHRRKNMSFTNEQTRKIDRENEILLKKIMSYTKPRPKPALVCNTPPPRVKASAAVNRSKQQRQIMQENSILCKKINNVKPTPSLSNHNHLSS